MPRARAHRRPAAPPEPAFTNLDKLLFPAAGFTKGELIRYYLDIAPWLLPHLRDRPVTLIRFPDGVGGESFYEKNASRHAPDWVATHLVPRRHRDGGIRYVLINDPPSLAWCANLAAIELHPFLHRAPALARPTQLVFDLDPGEGADLLACAEVAFLIKRLLDGLRLESFAKVSGSKGLQLHVPLNSDQSYDATRAFAKGVAELLEQAHPDLVVSNMSKARRRERVLIDWSQNHEAKTTVSVYSVRGKRAEPYVSLPVRWEELRRLRDPAKLSFTPEAALRRVRQLGDLFAPLLELRQDLPSAFGKLGPDAAPAPLPSLAAYEAKRDFTRTREPAPKPPRKTPRKSRARPTTNAATADTPRARFVIQKHDATRLHYDLRLEMHGTLKSWAVPKGLPLRLREKHAAIEVEDHPLDYMTFEGTIPKGQYGGGTVMVWDIGEYELLGGSHASGNLKFRLAGKKLRGEWHLFKIRGDEDKPTWLVAKSGEPAEPLTEYQQTRSVLTRRTLAGIARAAS
jgi:bifunctional non-homologous end joining protein LigD